MTVRHPASDAVKDCMIQVGSRWSPTARRVLVFGCCQGSQCGVIHWGIYQVAADRSQRYLNPPRTIARESVAGRIADEFANGLANSRPVFRGDPVARFARLNSCSENDSIFERVRVVEALTKGGEIGVKLQST
jgi:hypothetical protein